VVAEALHDDRKSEIAKANISNKAMDPFLATHERHVIAGGSFRIQKNVPHGRMARRYSSILDGKPAPKIPIDFLHYIETTG
jgi:hypothetical protein